MAPVGKCFYMLLIQNYAASKNEMAAETTVTLFK